MLYEELFYDSRNDSRLYHTGGSRTIRWKVEVLRTSRRKTPSRNKPGKIKKFIGDFS